MPAQMFVLAVVGQNRKRQTELFQPGLAAWACAARIHHAPNCAEVARFELGHAAPHAFHPANDLMARHARVDRIVPFIAGGMKVRVADSAVENFDFDIRWAGFAPGDAQRSQGRTGALRCISMNFCCIHVMTIHPAKDPSLAERANPLAKHAKHFGDGSWEINL